MVSCWKHDTHEAPVPIHREDMVADFAPMFDTLHDESCMKCASLSEQLSPCANGTSMAVPMLSGCCSLALCLLL